MRLPEDGHIALFDHSWYGRVLVERVEKVVKKKVWRKAYDQINELERWLVDDGQVVVKLRKRPGVERRRKIVKTVRKLNQWLRGSAKARADVLRIQIRRFALAFPDAHRWSQ